MINVCFRGYVITVPNVMIRNTTSSVCVSFHNSSNNVTIEFQFSHRLQGRISSQVEQFTAGEHIRWQLIGFVEDLNR